MFLPQPFLTRAEVRWLALTVITAALVKGAEKLIEKAVERAVPDKTNQKETIDHGT